MAPSLWAMLPPQTTRHPNKLLIPRARAQVSISSPRSRTLQACDPCRNRKAKCNGAKPTCINCERLAIECTYSEQRRSRERKELDQLKDIIQRHDRLIRSILSRLLDPLPSAIAGHPETLPSVISTIRHSVSVHDAATRLVRQVPVQRPGISLENIQLVWRTQLSGQPQLVERQAPYRVHTVELWSDQVDNMTASHLFSLFFVWDNPTWRLIEPSLFLNGFCRGDTRFCSSLLVNTMLFYACHFSYNLARPWDRRRETQTAKQLFKTLEKHWRQDKNRICLPTMQSSFLLGLFFCAMGKGNIGVRYIQYGALMALKLGLHTQTAETFRAHCETDTEQNLRAHKIIACAVYEIETMSAQVSGRSSVWSAPPEISLDEDEACTADLNEKWTPYPFTAPVYRPYPNTSTWARRTLLNLVNDVTRLSSHSDMLTDLHHSQRAAALYKRLDIFRRTLPAVLDIDINRSPHNICLHLYYHSTVVNLCGIFRGDLHNPTANGLIPSTSFDPCNIMDEAMKSMGTLILLYRACHGWKSLPVVMMHYFLVVSVHAASRLKCSKWREILVSCVAGLWHMSLAWQLCRAFLRTIDLVLNSSVDPALVPEEVRSILDEHREKLWTRGQLESLAANYVVHYYPDQLFEASESGSHCFHGKRLGEVIREFD
ncbi:hypothetical protein BO83DRAFT_350807 [Aspergillus eucalypticola CBS 122712]|uniref:Zn(2)-C6 fungal-type domain-containing protein n=1 Tax=Aspergillus eucalypticola (strain CBS 122712 / IBT 29274) TaxID=1448314 RepID=A0A317UNR9_ASPEC|nr:uncharacterized protein BO83DRAFT_350807 [Aspergillus eucalypticola CBS 122712]PWY61710.1 hypothetical protein BO83DRAFT_350807 [Aspergillus eucalypticola CBS 122712]